MAIQYSVAVNNAKLNAIETVVGTSAIMKLRTGSVPANCAAADSGTVCATLNLPSDWLVDAANASKAKAGTWQDTAADASGTIGYFRIYASDGTTCHMQGTVTITGGGGDLTLDNNVVAVNQVITISAFMINIANT